MQNLHWKYMFVPIMFVLFAAFCTSAYCSGSKTIKSALANQGFSGVLTGKIEINELGVIAIGNTQYHIFYYSSEGSKHPGEAIHASYRIILMTGNNMYLGSYIVEDQPTRLTHNSILFGYTEDLGNTIDFDKNGPPKQVLLDGYLLDLAK